MLFFALFLHKYSYNYFISMYTHKFIFNLAQVLTIVIQILAQMIMRKNNVLSANK